MEGSQLDSIDRAIGERRYDEARAALRSASTGVAIRPELKFRIARLHRKLGELDRALALAREARAASPADLEIRQFLGEALREAGDFTGAIAEFGVVLNARPNDAPALRESALTAKALGLTTVAEQLLRTAAAANPNDGALIRLLGEIEIWQGRIAEGLASLRRAVAADPSEANYDSLLFHSLFSPEVAEGDLRGLVDDFAARHGGRIGPAEAAFANAPDPGRKLNVGFLSSSLRTNHNSLYFLAPVLFHHDKSRVALHLYGDVDYAGPAQSPLTRLVAACRDTRQLDDEQVAKIIRDDRIDVLVSALGRGSESPRTRVLRYRPAPVQICFHHVMTTGYRDADYWIADPLTVPDNAPEYFSERILHIPWNFAFTEMSDHGPVAPLPAVRNGFVTFASTTHLWKLNPAVLRLWREVLTAMPTARLRIKALALQDAGLAESWRKHLSDFALPMDRIELCKPHPDFWRHMQFYNEVDILLDTFPYGCGNSALEALWMGVPVVTLAGQRFAGRQGLSMLASVGLPDLAAPTPEAYVERAATLAGNVPQLEALRQRLRAQMRASPLCDLPAYSRSVEAAIRQAWESWCVKAGPFAP